MATRCAGSSSFWHRLRNGPWGKPVIERVEAALDDVVRRLRDDAITAIILFGSYARGEFGRKSDIHLMVIHRQLADDDHGDARRRIIDTISETESSARLPMHIAPLVVGPGDLDGLGPTLLHELWVDGIVLYGEASALATLQPAGLAPWTVVRFSLHGVKPNERVRLARRLHGTHGRPGIVRLPGINLARGAALVPAEQARAVRAALDEAGATYDLIPVWRET